MNQPATQSHEQQQNEPPKIYFSNQVFGKQTNKRCNDPSMFELLSWNTHGVQESNFKKKDKFRNPSESYMNMISKKPWISESQQSYLNFNTNSIEVNHQVFQEVQNYIESRQSKQDMVKKRKAQVKVSDVKDKKTNDVKKSNLLKNNQSNIKTQGHSSNVPQNQEHMQSQTQQKKAIKKRPQSANHSGKVPSSPKPSSSQSRVQVSPSTTHLHPQISSTQQQKLIQDFKQTTRWIPNSAFATYFGKPPFQNYGRGNTKPVDGGLVYGTYLYSHNVYPHRGTNTPAKVQSYPVALMKAKSHGKLVPTQPKTKCQFIQNKRNNQREAKYCGKDTGAIQAAKNVYNGLQIQVPDLRGIDKFGGSKSMARTDYSTK